MIEDATYEVILIFAIINFQFLFSQGIRNYWTKKEEWQSSIETPLERCKQ